MANESFKPDSQIEKLIRARDREREARQQAERLLEEKSRELYFANEKLKEQYQKLKRRNAEAELLNSVVYIARETRDFNLVMKIFLEAVCKMCEWPIGHVYVPDPDNENKVIPLNVWYLSDPDQYTGFVHITQNTIFEKNIGLPGQVYGSKKTIWIEDVHQNVNFPRAREMQNLNIHGAFGVPIKISDQIVAISEFFTSKNLKIDQPLIDLVETAAFQLGIALEKQKAEQELQKKYAELENTHRMLSQTQTQLIQSEKMASLGVLVAGVAHEINNPVGFVMSNLETLDDYLKALKKLIENYTQLSEAVRNQDEKMKTQSLKNIETVWKEENIAFILEDLVSLVPESLEGTHRIEGIVSGLKNFARSDEANFTEADINACIESTLKVAANELKYKADVRTEFSELPKILCFPGELNQVFLNLLTNAAQAIETRGEIRVITRIQNGHILIQISDTGSGIKPENIPKIFDPFFTTKPVGQGTGLGLSISHGIVKKHGGEILVESERGKGTTVKILIPMKTDHEDR